MTNKNTSRMANEIPRHLLINNIINLTPSRPSTYINFGVIDEQTTIHSPFRLVLIAVGQNVYFMN